MKVLGIALCSTLLLLDLGFLVYLFLERPGYLGLTSRYCVFGLQHIYALGLLLYHAYLQHQYEPQQQPQRQAWFIAFVVGNCLIFGMAQIYMATKPDFFLHVKDSSLKDDLAVMVFIILYFPFNLYFGAFCSMSLMLLLMYKIHLCCNNVQGQQAIQRLEGVKELATGNQDPCAICFCEYTQGEEIYRSKCGHFFHKDCLVNWLKQRPTCPICRSKTI